MNSDSQRQFVEVGLRPALVYSATDNTAGGFQIRPTAILLAHGFPIKSGMTGRARELHVLSNSFIDRLEGRVGVSFRHVPAA